MQIQKQELLSILHKLEPFFIEKGLAPILEYLYFKDTTIQLYTGDFFVTAEESPTQGLKGIVRSNLLLRIVEQIQSDTIDLTIKNKVLKISSGSFTADLTLFADGYFKFENTEDEELLYELPISVIAESLPKMFLPNTETQKIFNSTFLKVRDNTLYLFSTNRASLCRISIPHESKDFSVFLPNKFCEKILTLFSEIKQGTFYFYEKSIKCVLDTITVIFPVEEAHPIDYEGTFLRYNDPNIEFYPIEILQDTVVRNFNLNKLLSDSTNKIFFLDFKEHEINITSKNEENHVNEIIAHSIGLTAHCKVDAGLLKHFVQTVSHWTYMIKKDTGVWAGYSESDNSRLDYLFLSYEI